MLRKNRGNNTRIKFIDASSFYEFDGKCNKLINLEHLANIYHFGSPDTNIYTEVEIGSIERNSALLSVSSYISSKEATYEQIDTDIIR
ncbi:hypothetical protein LOS73_02365 [Pseudoalteromonas sp. SCSIO 43210]